jgi:WD40 repeat protein
VATTTLNGRTAAVTGSVDETVRIWDLTTGQQIGKPLVGHTDIVWTVATTLVDGRPVAVTGSHDETVRIWDLTTGQQIGEPLTGHTGGVRAMATTLVDGRPVAVTGGQDETVRIWDLTTGQQIGEPLTGHTEMVWSVVTTMVDARPIAVTGSWNGEVRVWDLATGQPDDGAFKQVSPVSAMTVGEVGGQAVILTAVGRWLRLADPSSGRRIGPLLSGHAQHITAVATTTLEGQPVAVTGSGDHTVRVWDLATGRQIGAPLPFPHPVAALTATPDGGILVCHGAETTHLTPA